MSEDYDVVSGGAGGVPKAVEKERWRISAVSISPKFPRRAAAVESRRRVARCVAKSMTTIWGKDSVKSHHMCH